MARGESPVDPRLVRALSRQLELRRAALDGGAAHVGWKLGMGDAESIGGEIAVGFLTSATRLEPGGEYRAAEAVDLRADAEVALELGRDVVPDTQAAAVAEAVAGYGAALELVDLGPPTGAEAIVAANVFHRAVALGPTRADLPPEVSGSIRVDGAVRGNAAAETDLAPRLLAAARVLASVGERLRAGDRVITGSVVQVAVRPGERVVADLGALGAVELLVAP